MDDSELVSSISGAPPNCATYKIKLHLEKKIGSDCIEKVAKRGTQLFVFFKHAEGLQRFHQTDLGSISFGGTDHKISTCGEPPAANQFWPLSECDGDEVGLYSKIHHWEDLHLPSHLEDKLCILVKGIEISKTHIDKVKLHFQSIRRSQGGPVMGLIRMTEGLLVFFWNQQDCQGCANKPHQTLDGREIEVMMKRIPKCHERKFALKDVGDQTTEETVALFVESCTGQKFVPTSCEKQPMPGVWLVEFGDDFDPSHSRGLILKVASRTLEGHKLNMSKISYPDCLKVMNIPASTTNDTIGLKFENQRLTGGLRGSITKIMRLENGAVYIYFSEYADASAIYERYKTGDPIVLGNQTLAIEFHYQLFSTEHGSMHQEHPVSDETSDEDDFMEKYTTDDTVVQPVDSAMRLKIQEFIRTNDKHLQKLKNAMQPEANVSFTMTRFGSEVKFSPARSQITRNYQKICEKKYEEFCSLYDARTETFDQNQLDKLRLYSVSSLLSEDAQLGKSEDVIITWLHNTVEVTGLKSETASRMFEIKQCLEQRVTELVSATESSRKIMQYCGVLEQLNTRNTDMKLCIDDEMIICITRRDDTFVQGVKNEVLSAELRIKKRMIKRWSDAVLVKFMQLFATEIETPIQTYITSENIKAAFDIEDGEPCLKAQSDAELDKATTAIKSLMGSEAINLNDATKQVMQTEEWKDFEKEQRKNIVDLFKGADDLIVTTWKKEIKRQADNVQKFLQDNLLKTDYITMTLGCARFIDEKSQLFSPEAPKYRVKCKVVEKNGTGLLLNGPKREVERARLEIKQLEQRIDQQMVQVNNPGMIKFYEGTAGQKFIEETERTYNCIILVDEKASRAQNAQQGAKKRKLKSVQIGKVHLGVWKADVSSHRCDAWINVTDDDIKLFGELKKFDIMNDGLIESELKRLSGSRNTIWPISTGAGRLQSCRRVIHAHLPSSIENFEESARNLKASIVDCLEKAESEGLKSIAIPPLTNGQVFTQSQCIAFLCEAAAHFIEDHPTTSIERVTKPKFFSVEIFNQVFCQIDFVESNNKRMLDELVKQVDLCTSKPAQMTALILPTIEAVEGYIEKQTTDIIVSVTNPQSALHMMDGPLIPKVLGQAAGSTVVAECKNYSGGKGVGDVFETSSGSLSCKRLYHAVIKHYAERHSEDVINSVVTECLKKADKAGHESICFPAIGTGGFNHPPDKVAKWMRQSTEKFTGNSLKRIIIILYPGNKDVIKAFKQEFDGDATKSTSFFAVGPIKVSVFKGDIINESTDVLVNGINDSFDLSQGAVSSKLLKVGGRDIQDELYKEKSSNTNIAFTSAGNLNCKKLLHVLVPDDDRMLKETVVQVLENVNKNCHQSVSLPALGTGGKRIDSKAAGQAMYDALQKFLKSRSRVDHLKTINIVIYEEKMLDDFTKPFTMHKRRYGGFSFLAKQVIKENWPSSTPEEEKSSGRSQIHLSIFSDNKRDIEEAEKNINYNSKSISDQKEITTDKPSFITVIEEKEIQELGEIHGVKITYNKNRYRSKWILEGLPADIRNAEIAINGILRELDEADRFKEIVVWKRVTAYGTWEDFPPRAAFALENAYKKKPRNNSGGGLNEVKVKLLRDGEILEHSIDLSGIDDEEQRQNFPIKREVKPELPPNWDSMDSSMDILESVVKAGEREFQRVVTLMENTGLSGMSIQTIKRIQNIPLHIQYEAKKAEVSRKITQSPLEMELFHGTTHAPDIVKHGFDRRYAGTSTGAKYGNGAYFATTAQYSHRFAQPDSNKVRTMFLAKVITGEYTQGKSGMMAAPPKGKGSGNELYDSVVDDIKNPTMFVIFKDASAYPTYLISYKEN